MKELSDKSKPQSLEELFRARMEVAEETPSDRVWERIEQGLDLKEAGYYKERVSWYKSLAAACMALLVCAAIYMYYGVNNRNINSDNGLATLSQTQNSPVIADNKYPQSPAIALPQNQIIREQPAGEGVANGTDVLSAQTSLANAKAGNKNQKSAIASNLPDNRADTKTNLNNTYVTARTGAKKSKQAINAPSGNLLTSSDGQHNQVAATGIMAQQKPDAATVLAEESDNDIKPLVSVQAWAGLTKVALAADSLWKPKAIEAVPPMLAVAPAAAPEPEKNRLARWSVRAGYAPQYFNQNLELASAAAPQYLTAPGNNNFNGAPAAAVNPAGYTQALDEFDRNTTSGFSYNTAVAAGYALNEHWSLETGLLFTQNVANSKSSYVFHNSYLAARYNYASPATGMNDTKDIGQAAVPTTALVASLSGQQNLQNSAVIQTPAFDTQYRYRAVGVPVKLNYQTKSRKSFYFASVGLLTNLLVQAQILSESSRVPDIKFGNSPESPFRPWQFATVLSAGKGFRVSKAISLRAGLEGTQYLTSLAAQPENLNSKQRKPYSIGVAFSSSYTLGR